MLRASNCNESYSEYDYELQTGNIGTTEKLISIENVALPPSYNKTKRSSKELRLVLLILSAG